MANPTDRFWTNEHENAFQLWMAFDPQVRAWRQAFKTKFGEEPNLEDPTFDYRKAWLAGDGPRPVPYDTVPHWGSTGKSPDHPTEWMNEFMQQFGFDPMQPGPNPPGADEFMQQQLQREDALARRGTR